MYAYVCYCSVTLFFFKVTPPLKKEPLFPYSTWTHHTADWEFSSKEEKIISLQSLNAPHSGWVSLNWERYFPTVIERTTPQVRSPSSSLEGSVSEEKTRWKFVTQPSSCSGPEPCQPELTACLAVFFSELCSGQKLWLLTAMGDVVSSHLDEAKREIISGENGCLRRVAFSSRALFFTPPAEKSERSLVSWISFL